MPQDNKEQADYWNDRAGNTWAELQDRLDTLLKPLSEAGLRAANVQDGERVLDVGCGCGDTSIALAAAGGLVQGVDLSQPMLERAQARSNQVEFIRGDAASFTPKQPYDLIFSRFGVMFFTDPTSAFKHLHSTLTGHGRLVFVCWQAPAANPWMSITGRAIAPYLPQSESPTDPTAPGPFAFADADHVHAILSDSGFQNIRLNAFSAALHVGNDPQDALKLQTRVGPAARVMAELDGETRDQALDAARTALAAHQADNGIHLDAAVWIASATAA